MRRKVREREILSFETTMREHYDMLGKPCGIFLSYQFSPYWFKDGDFVRVTVERLERKP